MYYTSDAWVLESSCNELVRGNFSFPKIGEDEVLIKPLYGCFEGNMLHAIKRNPINICEVRKENRIVLGNAGVVEVQEVGKNVKNVKLGEKCIFLCNGLWDKYGYPIKIAGYDCEGSIGLLSKITKTHKQQLIPVPENSNISLEQWAAFSLRYITAWANWKVAYCCYLTQIAPEDKRLIKVFGWGGGVAFAELELAHMMGCEAFMTTSKDSRSHELKQRGIKAINRNIFSKENFEKEFLEYIREATNNEMVSIFIDNIGGPLFNVTLKSLARQGVLTTSGWKNGALTPFVRSFECINRHLFVHTHYATYAESLEAVDFANKNLWVPPHASKVYAWDEINTLIKDYEIGALDTYFPIFAIN